MKECSPIRNEVAGMNKIVNALMRTAHFVNRICRVVCCILLILIVGATFLQIICRKIFSSPLSWTEEFTRLLFVWLNCLGCAIAIQMKNQIQFDFLVSRLMSPRLQNIVRILTNIVIVLFFFLLLPPTMRLVQSMNTIPSAALSWPSGLPHLGYLAGLCAMIVAFLGDCMEAASELTRKGGAPI